MFNTRMIWMNFIKQCGDLGSIPGHST